MAEEYGTVVDPPPLPTIDRVDIGAPRIQAPDALATICSNDKHDRAAHAYGRSYPDKLRAFQGDFRNAPDLVAYPSSEEEVSAVLEWCSDNGYAAIPYGGGSSVVDGVNPPEGYDGIVTIDLTRLDQVLEIDESSRAARIQAGVLGPALEAQLKPHGYTLRHFPQSFEFSSLGGWIVTRSGGHYATNHTHIDEFVESVRMVTPRGIWESRRLPGERRRPESGPPRHRQRGHSRDRDGSVDADSEAAPLSGIRRRPLPRLGFGLRRNPPGRPSEALARQSAALGPGRSAEGLRVGWEAVAADHRFRISGGAAGRLHPGSRPDRPRGRRADRRRSDRRRRRHGEPHGARRERRRLAGLVHPRPLCQEHPGWAGADRRHLRNPRSRGTASPSSMRRCGPP